MIDSDDIYKYLGFIVVVVLVMVFVSKCMRMHFSVIEGLITRSNNSEQEEEDSNGSVANLAQQVLDKTQEIEDKLLIEKYKSDYEDLIINTDAMLTAAQLEQLKFLAGAPGPTGRNQPMMMIIGMDFTKTALNSMMKDLDKKSSSGGGGLGGGLF